MLSTTSIYDDVAVPYHHQTTLFFRVVSESPINVRKKTAVAVARWYCGRQNQWNQESQTTSQEKKHGPDKRK
jgi:hypothetical protein